MHVSCMVRAPCMRALHVSEVLYREHRRGSEDLGHEENHMVRHESVSGSDSSLKMKTHV